MNIVSSSRRKANTLSFFFHADCFFSLQKASEKRINKKRTFIHALRNVDILSVARDSAIWWFSLSFDDDNDLIVEDDDEDDDG